jgi:hypothetical protein
MDFKLKSDENRQIHINMDSINIYVARYVPNTEFELTLLRKKKTVSDAQRKYYYAIVLPGLMNALGYDPEDADMVHRQLKIVFFGVKCDNHGIYREKEIPSVFSNQSDKPIDIKTKFIEWVCRKASENGEYIPSPGERNE